MSGFGNLEISCLRLLAHPVVESIWAEHWSTDIAKRGIAGHDEHRPVTDRLSQIPQRSFCITLRSE